MADPREDFVRDQMSQVAASMLSLCRPTINALTDEKRKASGQLESDVQTWIDSLTRARTDQTVMSIHTDSELRFRTDVAIGFQGAIEFLADKRPRVPALLLPGLATAVLMSAHLRLQTQGQAFQSSHDREAAALYHGIVRLIASTGTQTSPFIRLLKDHTTQQLAAWMEASPEEYDRQLAPVLRFLAQKLAGP